MSKQNEIFNRATGLLVIEVINSNPNGDPDKESDPRWRDDQRGEISPVSFKRKVRDLIDEKDGQLWSILSRKFDPPLKPEEFQIFEQRYRDRNLITKELRENDGDVFKQKYWDGRIFGNTFLEKEPNDEDESASPEGKKRNKKENQISAQKKTIKTGVVQFGLGLSVAPIRIGRKTTTSKAGVEEGKKQGMAPLSYRIVEHGIYCMPFFVNPSMAGATGCTKLDIELLLKVIPYAYSNTASYIRCNVPIIHAWYMEHKSPLGSCSDFDLISALTPKKLKDPDKPSTSRSDYEIPKELPKELRTKIDSIRDLMQDVQ